MTETGLSLGTPHYMSPEQATAEKEITARSDVYSLGSVLYEMLAGAPPHHGGSAQQIIMKIITEEAQPVTKLRKAVPPNVAAAVAKSLEKLPADRFASAAQFAEALATPGFATAAPVPGQAVAGARLVPLQTRLAALAPWVLVAALAVTSLWLTRRGGETEPPMRFAVDLDSAQGFPETSPVLMTPDGRTVIVTALVGRRNVLLARRLDRLEATVIPGSEGAERAFLSFDGRWVAFAARGKLMKLPIEGGTPVALADSRWGGGTWGRDGTIIYTQTYQTGLWRVSAGGGEARAVTTPDSSSGELAHWWPQLLPDGRHVVFTAYRTPIERATIEVLDLKSGTRRVLLQGGVMGRYAASGHLLFVRDRSILVVPFDVRRLAVTGAPVVAVDDVAMGTIPTASPPTTCRPPARWSSCPATCPGHGSSSWSRTGGALNGRSSGNRTAFRTRGSPQTGVGFRWTSRRPAALPTCGWWTRPAPVAPASPPRRRATSARSGRPTAGTSST
jgi:serine/threonine-protein kinase